jgi:hypothetical protein
MDIPTAISRRTPDFIGASAALGGGRYRDGDGKPAGRWLAHRIRGKSQLQCHKFIFIIRPTAPLRSDGATTELGQIRSFVVCEGNDELGP